MRNFTNPPAVTPVPVSDIVGSNQDIVGNVGIQSTPVIAAGTLYLVARTKENGSYLQRLHALDITTGASRSGSPVTITGSVPGSAPDSTVTSGGSVITFNPKMEQQRAALALSNGVVLVSWAGHHDLNPYHGWVMGFDATTLQPVGVFAVSADYYAGGIWQGGRAPVIDAQGNAYFATGNGRWDGVRNFGDSLLKFSVSRTGMALLDYFTPGNESTLNINDDDLSGSGFTLLPGTNLLLGGGKEGVLYLLDAGNLGKKVTNDTQVVQKIPVNGGHVMGGPVYWNSSTVGPLVYNWSEDDVLLAYRFSGGKLLTPPFAQGAVRSPGHPGGSLTISARGSTANTGIVWASMPTSEDAISGLHAGIVRAFNAETLTEIWNSEQNPARDRAGTLMKFVPPVVVDGKVFMPNHQNAVAVYGLLPIDPGGGGGTGHGLAATYFDNSDLTGATVKRVKRVDSTIDFVWGSASPAVGIGPETFSARWTGEIEPQFSETYTFYTVSNDGVRLWINGVRVVNNWTNHGTTENSGTIALTGGKRYPVTMEYYEDTGNATARLLWSSASTPKAVVPNARLYAGAASAPAQIHVNFQTASAPVPAGYLKDAGLAFGDRGNGQAYGWNQDNTTQMRDRNNSVSPDQRYDTLAYMQRPENPDAIWEIAVPNGTYAVHLVAGDPSYYDIIYKLAVEGVLTVNGTSNTASRWVEGTASVTVSDGRLTIRSASGATANKMCFVDITPQ
jgi:hypothetical protein